MQTQHTPGPWAVNTRTSSHGYAFADTVEPSVCDMVSSHSPEETMANARLIAAAPELLAALAACLRVVSEYRHKVMTGRLTGDLIPGDCEPELLARAALAKAGGSQ